MEAQQSGELHPGFPEPWWRKKFLCAMGLQPLAIWQYLAISCEILIEEGKGLVSEAQHTLCEQPQCLSLGL